MVVQDTELFDPTYPTVLVVPMTGDRSLAIAEYAFRERDAASRECSPLRTSPTEE